MKSDETILIAQKAGLREYSYIGKGYSPIVDFESWRVAFLNYAPSVSKEGLTKLERHMQTDEVFVLQSGNAYLILGGTGTSPCDIDLVKMQPNKIYNFEKGAWHHIIADPDCLVLIVENQDTTEKNSEYIELTPAQKQDITAKISF